MCRRSCTTSTALSLNKENAMSTPLQPSGTLTIKPPHLIRSPSQQDSRFQRPKNHQSKNDRRREIVHDGGAELPCRRDKDTDHGSL